MRRLILASLPVTALPVLLALVATGCARDAKPDTPASSGPPAAAALNVPAVAVKTVEVGPDADPLVLTEAFAAAVAHTSGAPVVAEPAVRKIMMSGCDSPPCDTEDTRAYANAAVVALGSVAQAGGTWLANGRALEGASVVARVTGSGKSALDAVQQIGWTLGAKLREALSPTAAAAPATTEGDK
jgi:hypothetical protein